MHMADALVSSAVGGAMWAASAGLAGYSAWKLKGEAAESRAPLMGVLGAFVFAAQMVNFSIPMTGSSGHLGGGLILAVLLGPHAAFIVMFSILAVQALFFADGGLLALGCNAFNLGFWPCFVAYPLVFRGIAGREPGRGRLAAGSMAAGIVSLQLGAFGVVAQTAASGISDLPFGMFLLLMQPIHLAIGVVEGAVTAALFSFVAKARPEILAHGAEPGAGALRLVLAAFAVAAVVTGGVLSWFASSLPDGLEWSMFKASGKEEPDVPAKGIRSSLAGIQEKTAVLPDYGFRPGAEGPGSMDAGTEAGGPPGGDSAAWPAISAGTTLSGLVGGLAVLVLAGLAGFCIRFIKRRP